MGELLDALRTVFDDRPFRAIEAATASVAPAGSYSALGDALPLMLHEKLREIHWRPAGIAKSLGRYFARVAGRWTHDGNMICRVGNSRKSGSVWQVVSAGASRGGGFGGFGGFSDLSPTSTQPEVGSPVEIDDAWSGRGETRKHHHHQPSQQQLTPGAAAKQT